MQQFSKEAACHYDIPTIQIAHKMGLLHLIHGVLMRWLQTAKYCEAIGAGFNQHAWWSVVTLKCQIACCKIIILSQSDRFIEVNHSGHEHLESHK